MERHRIKCVQGDVLLLDDFPDWLHAWYDYRISTRDSLGDNRAFPSTKRFMDQNHQNSSGTVPNNSEGFGSLPNGSESFRSVPHNSETFGTAPKGSESFRSFPKASERKENHTLTVRDAARMFETAGVARTERSIVNWCQANRTGIARLDSYFDPNERKYYLTPESVERAIQEEIQKSYQNKRAFRGRRKLSESFGNSET